MTWITLSWRTSYDVRAFGSDPYNAQEFVKRWGDENSTFGVVKVIQGAKTESVPLGELKKLSEQRKLLFDEQLMQFAMGNCITLVDTNGNRKLYKQRQDQKNRCRGCYDGRLRGVETEPGCV